MVDTANEARTINGLLREAAAAYGDRPAIRFARNGEVREHSYRDLYRDSLRLCGALQRRFPAGTHIALTGKTTYRYLVALNAVMMSGCTVVPLAADAPAEETVRLLRDADAAVIFYDDALRESEHVFSACPLLRYAFALDAAPEETLPAPETVVPRETPEGCAAIIYTSGSTGVRKGAMLTSGAIVSNVYFKEMTFEGGHVALNVLPMHHIFSFSCDYLKNLKDGVTV
ncbi:MAG: acyl--CoA ligase, partial [Clostridia bacterium]|nr:acyl--CoA ligase [Clostridia bacterium]